MAAQEGQQVLRGPYPPLAKSIYNAAGVVRLESIEWPELDPEQPMTMLQYIGEIGIRLDAIPRESSVEDTALDLLGDDFRRAKPDNLREGLYFPSLRLAAGPIRSVVRVNEKDSYHNMDPQRYPGTVMSRTGVMVTEEIYSEMVKAPAFYATQIATRTEAANNGNPKVEEREDLGDESALYALFDYHDRLELRNQDLLAERKTLAQLYRSVTQPEERRVKNLEPVRLDGTRLVQVMVRLGCKGLGYGTTLTRSTMNAVVSNMYRSDDPAKWMERYSHMAIMHNDATRGKVNESIHAILKAIHNNREGLINNIDREYEDPKPKKSTAV